jgi:UPF0176 protein
MIVASFYRFVAIADCATLVDEIEACTEGRDVRGTVLIAPEGINGSLCGTCEDLAHVANFFDDDPRFQGIPMRRSETEGMVFDKLVIKEKPEIVTMRAEPSQVAATTAKKIDPDTFRTWLRAGEEMVLIDTRNQFEYDLGTFRGALDPQTSAFHEFPDFIRKNQSDLARKKIVMFCTGGIRCEKATSWMREEQGMTDVFQLDGGVLRYFEEIDDADLDWQGELFVFDNRVALDASLRPTETRLCSGCGAPVQTQKQCRSCQTPDLPADHSGDAQDSINGSLD